MAWRRITINRPQKKNAMTNAMFGEFIATINDYLFNDLGYKTELSYRPNFYSSIGNAWDWKHRTPNGNQQLAVNSSVDLSQAIVLLEEEWAILG